MRRSRSRDYEELLEELRRGVIQRGYLLTGEEFQREEALGAVLEGAVDPRTRLFNLDMFTAGEGDMGAIINIALSPPMMGERRTVVIKSCERLSSAHWKQCASLIDDLPASTCLILSGEELDSRNPILVSAQKWMKVLNFRPLYDNEIPRWIERRGQQMGKTVTSAAAAMLHAQVGNDLGELANELEKLSVFVGDRKHIAAQDVDAAVALSASSSIFKLTDAIGHRRRATAMELVDRLLDDGQSSMGVVSMIGRYLVTLSKLIAAQRMGAPEKQLQEIAGVHPYFLKQYIAQAQHFSEQQLFDGLGFVLATEDGLKSGSGRDQLLLEQLVYRLCQEDR